MNKLEILLTLVLASQAYLSDPPLIFKREVTGHTCQDAISDQLLNLQDLSNAFYILSTGKYLNNWGAYGSCMSTAEEANFWMVEVTGKLKDAPVD